MIRTTAYGLEDHPLRIGNIEIPCFILENHDTVITRIGAQKALGYDGKSENWLYDLLTHIHKFTAIPELLELLKTPQQIHIKRPNGSLFATEAIAAEVFLEICKTIAHAKEEGYLNLNQLRFSKAAQAILSEINDENLESLIADATGFNFLKQGNLLYFSQFLLKTLEDRSFQWTSTLSEDFLNTLLSIHGLDWKDFKERPHIPGKIIHEIVFSRLHDALLDELRNTAPKRSYKRKGQKAKENQHPQLKEYIAVLQSLLKAADYNWNIFVQLLNRSYPQNPGFTTRYPVFSDDDFKKPELSAFNKILSRLQ